MQALRGLNVKWRNVGCSTTWQVTHLVKFHMASNSEALTVYVYRKEIGVQALIGSHFLSHQTHSYLLCFH